MRESRATKMEKIKMAKKQTVGQRLKKTQSALCRMNRQMAKVIEERDGLQGMLGGREQALDDVGRRLACANMDIQNAARFAIKYRNQRDELDRRLFLAQRMVGDFALQASSKLNDIELSSRPLTEDEPATREILNRMANGPNQNEECQQGVSSPVAMTVNCRKVLPEDPEKVDS